MKPFRLLLIGGTLLVALLVAVVVVAFNSRFQSWAVRRALAGRPELKATIGSVSASLGRVEITGLRLESHGAVLTLPSGSADLPLLSAGIGDKLLISHLAAKGWTLDLTKARPLAASVKSALPASISHEFSFLSSAHAAEAGVPPVAAPAKIFQGIFAQLRLPIDLSLDGVDLAGIVILPEIAGRPSRRLRVTLTGGGLAAGRDGQFSLAVDAETSATSASVDSLTLQATFIASMDTPRTFARLQAKADATAMGAAFPRGVKLAAEFGAIRGGSSENYVFSLANGDKQLLSAQAAYPNSINRLEGTWKLDVHDTDFAPFTLGRALPAFEADGEGRFDADASFAEFHASGKINAASGDLSAWQVPFLGSVPGLAALGVVRLNADFDLKHHGDTIRIEGLNVTLAGAQPVATVRSRQAFECNTRSGELQGIADPASELFSIELTGLPLVWVEPFVGKLTVTGGDLRGELTATARNGGFAIRTKTPVTTSGVSVAKAGKPLFRAVDLMVNASADYTSRGWQAEFAPLTVQSGGSALFALEAKAGQLAGRDQPVKTTGKFSANLASLLTQPVAAGKAFLTRGDAAGEFVASFDAKQSMQVKIALSNLVADPKVSTEKLPSLTADLRADIAPDGKITLSAPLLIERDGRKSDLTVEGTLAPTPLGFAVDANVTSTVVVVGDAKMLGGIFASPRIPAAATATAPTMVRDVAPPWAGLSGQLTLALKKVVYSDAFQASDVTGTLRLDAGALKFDSVRAGLGDAAEAKLTAGVTFTAGSAAPYALVADLAVNDFDPTPFFKALNPSQPATVEGKFTITSKLAGSAVHPTDFANAARGDVHLTSRGGVFRGLPVNVASKSEAVGKLAALLAKGGSAFDVFKGKPDDSEITSLAKAVAEVAKMLAAIPYDQLSVVLTRDDAGNTLLKDFTLISPEMRIAGGGQATYRPGGALLDEAVAMEFKLRARGHTGDLLKFLGKLEARTDDLGYAACTLPLKIGGTLGKPDTSELNNALASLALEKSGVLDKAGDLLNRLIPGGK